MRGGEMLPVAQAGSRTCACIDFGKNSPSNRKVHCTTQTIDNDGFASGY